MDMFRGLSPWGARVGDLEPCENSARSWQVAFLERPSRGLPDPKTCPANRGE